MSFKCNRRQLRQRRSRHQRRPRRAPVQRKVRPRRKSCQLRRQQRRRRCAVSTRSLLVAVLLPPPAPHALPGERSSLNSSRFLNLPTALVQRVMTPVDRRRIHLSEQDKPTNVNFFITNANTSAQSRLNKSIVYTIFVPVLLFR